MKRTTFASIAAAALISLPLLASAAQLDPSAAKNLLRQKVMAKPMLIHPMDASLASCAAYKSSVDNANRTYASCLANPPAGSPIDNFNKMTNMQLGQYCGSKTMHECTDMVSAQQTAYCEKMVLPLRQRAEQEKQMCGQARKECTDARAQLQHLEKTRVGQMEKKKQLEAELAKLNQELNTLNGSIARASQNVQHQCGGAAPKPAQPTGPQPSQPPTSQPILR